jgi:Rrf2 family iron-sulfur cluster assembly transcriptional regulator
VRLEITRKADLATRVLLALGRLDHRVKAPELSELVGTTPGFLSQVIAPLSHRGWVRSDPGPTGGYRVAVELEQVSVLDVIEAVEGPTDTGRCVLEERECGRAGPCVLHLAWSEARGHLLEELARTPLSGIADPGAVG